MVRIRLARMGTKGRPFYRIVVLPGENARNGRFVEQIGTYDPLKNPAEVKLDKEKAVKWISNGAKASETVERLLKNEGVVFGTGEKKARRKAVKPRVKTPKPVKPKKVKPKVEEPVAEAAAETAAETSES